MGLLRATASKFPSQIRTVGWRDLLIAIASPALVFAVRLTREGKPVLRENALYLQVFGVAVVVGFCWLALRSASEAYRDKEKRAEDAEDEIARLRAKPIIEYVIKEALIIPHGDQADCFVKLAVQNITDVRCQNPQDYKIVLRIKGDEIKRAVPLDLQEFELAYYKYVEKYTSGEYPDRYEEARELRREALPNLLENKGILVKGEITEGWLGFSVYYVDKWNQNAEYLGTRIEYKHHYEEGEPDEDSAYPVDEYNYTPNTTAIESLKLIVTDAYFQIRTIETNGPFEDNHRNIVKTGSSPVSRQIMPWRML